MYAHANRDSPIFRNIHLVRTIMTDGIDRESSEHYIVRQVGSAKSFWYAAPLYFPWGKEKTVEPT